MRDELKTAIRSLWASRTLTLAALSVLTLGIGASTAIFSVVDSVVLRGLPFHEQTRLVAIGQRFLPVPDMPPPPADADPRAVTPWAPQNFFDVAERQQLFESVAAIQTAALTMRGAGGEAEEVRAQRVTADFFRVLRVEPVLGGTFTRAHERDGAHRVVVLSDTYWRGRFGADPGIIGRAIPLEGAQYEVVGVMAPGFEYPVGSARPAELWMPYVAAAGDRIRGGSFNFSLQGIARLKAGVSIDQAEAHLIQLADTLRAEHPKWNAFATFGARPLRDHILGANTRQWMLMLLAAVAIVLIIACANVANLMLAKATTREREIGVRAALGAGRWRLVRSLLTESIVLSLTGTVLGVVAAIWGINLLKAALPDGIPRVASIGIDLRVLSVAGLMALLTGLIFGAIPAAQMTRPDLTYVLKDGTRGAGVSRRRQRVRHGLIIGEVALAVVLLVGAALFVGSFRTLMAIDPGFSPDNVLTVGLQPRVDRTQPAAESARIADQFQALAERLTSAPGVGRAALIGGGLPMGGGGNEATAVSIPGRELTGPSRMIGVRWVTAAYHEVLGIPLREGRYLTEADRTGPPVGLMNELAARRLFPGESAVGKTIGVRGERVIVGVVADVHHASLEVAPQAEAYLPMTASNGSATTATLVIKTAGHPLDVVPAVRTAIAGVIPGMPLRNVRSMEQILDRQTAQRRFNMMLLTLFGVLGVTIAAVGVYGVLAHLVSQRTREIGVRMALGATRMTVVRLILTHAATLVVAGLVIGGAAAWYLSESARGFLFRMDTHDPRAYAVAMVCLIVAALIATLIPAWRAASVSPTEALRQE